MAVTVIHQAPNGSTGTTTYDEGNGWSNDDHNNLHILNGDAKIASHKNNRWLDVQLGSQK